MTPEKQRIAIAEACGWDMSNHKARRVDWWENTLPDYLNDLNDMHEAEKVLTPRQHRAYAHHLLHLCGTLATEPWDLPIGASYHATAAQRAEAFLWTIGKWEDA